MRTLPVIVASFPICLDIRRNLAAIHAILDQAQPGDLVILPEGALSGYAEDPSFLHRIDRDVLAEAQRETAAAAARAQIHVIVGSGIWEHGSWYNAGLYFGPQGKSFIYRKINLATAERGVFTAGSTLPVLELAGVRIGVQICREIRYPEQWRALAQEGAEVFVYLTNAIGDPAAAPVWRSHLISRAAENQRFVLAVNNAQPATKCPSMIVAPDGRVIWETDSPDLAITRQFLDLGQVSNWYLDQARRDVVTVELAD